MWLVALLLPVFLTSCDSKSDDIVGKWTYRAYHQGIGIDGVDTYYKGGKGNYSGTITTDNGNRVFIVGSFTWSIDGDQLHSTITSSNVPQLIPVGFTSVDNIISPSLSGDTIVLEDDGIRTTYHRE
ncbi:hypothetical protein Rhal01_03538 [Rubritalea halochordaticola]|uniref:Lipocalin-like domain-containing protein n=2 Tax=Rubritalea halochordaticola TaxID=714537 RepID=A0ABP9V5S9_9BACT